MDEGEEGALVARAKAGENAAFDALFGFYRQMVYEYAMNWLGEHDKAEDATQKTLIFAWQRLKDYEYQPGKFVFWLLANARNRNHEIERGYESEQELRIRDRFKGEQAAKHDLGGWTEDESADEWVDPCERIAEVQAQEDGADELLRRLTPRQREVVELRADGLTTAKIAAQLGISEDSVWQHISRAKKRLSGIPDN